MSQIIADLYEIQEKIGAGGGGIVYLGRHIRLDKKVVLKADKRTLSTGKDALRREVDLLKNLSHTYIPQVYDFVQQDGVVYTVMDFIDGESLDKLLGRRQLPTQPQVIRWACQLLEALSYLHSRPPHGILHGDIKPANIMLRPNGDICLIDFNIALALGEDGAVKVGFSRGYASPEHYGADYISSSWPAAVKKLSDLSDLAGKAEADDDKTCVDTDSDMTCVDAETDRIAPTAAARRTQAESDGGGMWNRSTSSKKGGILLDTRSDIYSLGATLYHLLSGSRPAQKAEDVIPLGADVCSMSVSAILQKAMDSDPDKRYQSAEEMLSAFRQLHKRDRRAIRHRRRMIMSAALLSTAFLAGGAAAFAGLKQIEERQTALALAEYSADSLAEGNVAKAIEQALQAIPRERNILKAPVTEQAQKALADALGVYDLSDGFKAAGVVELPSAPFEIAVSGEGTRFAAVYAYEAVIYDTEDGQKLVTLPTQASALSDVIFVDESRVVYAGDKGVCAYDLDARQELWTGEEATTLCVSPDHSTVAAVNRDEEYAVIYRMSDGASIAKCSFEGRHLSVAANDIFANPKNDIFALNADGSKMAVSFAGGGLVIFDLKRTGNDLIIYEESDYTHFEGGFYGSFFAFCAEKGGEARFGLIDMESGVWIGDFASQDTILVQANERGVYVANGSLLVEMEPETEEDAGYLLEQKELAYTDNLSITGFAIGEKYVLAATDDGNVSFYDSGAHRLSTVSCGGENCDFAALAGKHAILGNRDSPTLRFLRLETHEESQLLAYDARYEHDEARISGDGSTVMLFGYRRFCIYDRSGELLTEVKLPEPDNIYDQQFVKGEEESWLEVSWYDGLRRRYSAKDGSLIWEEQGDAPARDLYEEFYTERYRIASSLHTAPEVYDLKSGGFIALLEEDSYLTYVTEAGDYLITEYIGTEGKRYGILLSSDLKKLAYLPELCDVIGDTLVFDYQSGDLRQCRIYSLQELIDLGEAYLSENMEEDLT